MDPALLVADCIQGGWLIRREGRRAWQALTNALNSGRMPASELADAALILVGGTLMLTPGFVTDVVGLVLILPFTRPLARRVLTRVVSRQLVAGCVDVTAEDRALRDTGPAADRAAPWSGARSSRLVGQADWTRFLGARLAAALPGAAVQVRRADLAAAEQLEALLEDVLELLLRTPLQEHVPVRADGLLGLGLALDPDLLSASAPQRGHSQSAGTSASTDIVISNSCPCGHA